MVINLYQTLFSRDKNQELCHSTHSYPGSIGMELKFMGAVLLRKWRRWGTMTAVALKQGQSYSPETIGNIWSYFWLSQLGGGSTSFSVARGQGGLYTFCQAQDNPPHRRIISPKMSVLPPLANPLWQGVLIILLMKMEKLGLRGAKRVAQDPAAHKQWSQSLGSRLEILNVVVLFPFGCSGSPATCLERERTWRRKRSFSQFSYLGQPEVHHTSRQEQESWGTPRSLIFFALQEMGAVLTQA